MTDHNDKFSALALDLDGTFLDSNSKPSPRNLEALRKAFGMGIELVIASGRMTPS
ncbi:HAD hydrolase family protein, partial [Fibrobacterota bacterium]